MKPSVGARSDVGRVRDGNEDAYLVQDPLYVVADGMGGHLAGDVASRIAVETISEQEPDGPDGIEHAVKAANAVIWEKAHEDPSLHGMGTTCTLVFVSDSEIHLAHVGDSRAYLLRDGDLSQLTDDHTLVSRMVKEGRLRPEEAEHHPQRNIVTRALGVDGSVEVDIRTLTVNDGDVVLICSDGLPTMVDADGIRGVLADANTPQQAADELVDLANEAGGEDNITAVVLAFDSQGAVEGHSAATESPTNEVPAVGTIRRDEPIQPGARAEEATGAFETPVPRQVVRPARRSRPVLATLFLIIIVLAAAAAAFKYLIVDKSYYVATSDGRVAIYRGLPDDVLGMRFQELLETSSTEVADLPDFLVSDVRDAIEADSLSDARQTVANLEERAQDEGFERQNDDKDRKQ